MTDREEDDARIEAERGETLRRLGWTQGEVEAARASLAAAYEKLCAEKPRTAELGAPECGTCLLTNGHHRPNCPEAAP